MMGERQVAQEALFYEFSLERHVPADHWVRAIDRFVDLSEIRAHLRPFYSEMGRPSIDPELMIRMLLIGYCFGIRSERRLCEEVHLNLAYRWFCRLGLEGNVPDHSTFSKNRHGRFRESDLLRELFETTVRRCIAEGLVGGEGFAVDASLIKADANKQRSADASEAVDWDDLARTRRSVREYLDTLDEAAWGAASEAKPKFVSRSDPAAQWTGALKGHAFFAYATNYLIDLDHAVIVDVEASRAIRQAEVGSARTMLDRTQERFGLWPARLLPTAPMARPRTWPGWCTSAGSSRTSRSSTNPSAATAPSAAPTSPMTTPAISTPARTGSELAASPEGRYRAERPLVDENGMTALPRQQVRLRRLLAEAAVLPQHAGPQDPALDPRGRSRH
jgi:transposase